jgi:hypothetical protein
VIKFNRNYRFSGFLDPGRHINRLIIDRDGVPCGFLKGIVPKAFENEHGLDYEFLLLSSPRRTRDHGSNLSFFGTDDFYRMANDSKAAMDEKYEKNIKNQWGSFIVMLVGWERGCAERLALAEIFCDAWNEVTPKSKGIILA